MKYLQRYGSFEKGTHKSLLSYRLAVNGIHDLCVIPWLHFESLINSTWPLPGTVDFRRLVEKRYEFPLADALHCFWPIGCNLSGNPYLSAKETLHLNLGDNKLFLIGCDEERIAHGV